MLVGEVAADVLRRVDCRRHNLLAGGDRGGVLETWTADPRMGDARRGCRPETRLRSTQPGFGPEKGGVGGCVRHNRGNTRETRLRSEREASRKHGAPGPEGPRRRAWAPGGVSVGSYRLGDPSWASASMRSIMNSVSSWLRRSQPWGAPSAVSSSALSGSALICSRPRQIGSTR